MFAQYLPWKKRVFLDCGGHNGSSVRKFRREFDQNKKFDIYTFEPNPQFAGDYSSFERHFLLPYATWIAEGEIDFFLDREDGDGSTLIREKTTAEEGGIGELDKETPLRVRCVDLSNWIRKNFSHDDYIVLKLDIEGAEYRVLEKMIQEGTFAYVDKLLIEWHWFKIGMPEHMHRQLLEKLAALKVPVSEWDAQEPRRATPDGTFSANRAS